MNKRLKSIIGSIEQLPVSEQLEIMQMMSQSLFLNYQHTLLKERFKKRPAVKKLVKDQQIKPISNLTDLKVDFWPEKESVDDFIEYIYLQRKGE